MRQIDPQHSPTSKPVQTARKKFASDLQKLSDEDLSKQTGLILWKVATIAADNPKNDAHWQKQFCKAEAQRRGKIELYVEAFARAGQVKDETAVSGLTKEPVTSTPD